jgi:hypothetical protein
MTTNPLDADRPPEPSRAERRRQRQAGGRRRDEAMMVPDVEFESYYGRNIVKAPPWSHDIPAYLFLGGLAAGSGLIGAGGAARNNPESGQIPAIDSEAISIGQ